MEIRVLRYFLTVARIGSITGAAEVLHITQPTLSRQLQDLERELGCPLFTRGRRRVPLTAEGILLRRRAEEILEMIRKTGDEIGSAADTVAGTISIGSGESDVFRSVACVMSAIHEAYPNIRFNLHSGNAEDVMERVDKGLLDFGVLIQSVDIAKYDHLALPAHDVWGVVLRSDHPLARKKSVTRSDLLNVPLIVSRYLVRDHRVKNACENWFGPSWNRLNIVSTYNLAYNAALLAEAGLGCVLVIDRLLNTACSGPLCFRPLHPRLEIGLDVIWKKGQVFSPAAELFLNRLRTEFVKTAPKPLTVKSSQSNYSRTCP